MPSFDKFNRRLHLYLGLALMPWLLMYGVSSLIVIHRTWFNMDKSRPPELLFEKEYHRAVGEQEDVRTVAAEILKDLELDGAFWAYRPDRNTVHIDRYTFQDATRVTYFIQEQKVKAELERMRVPQVIVRMHFRGGYYQPLFWHDVWAFLVDLACVGIVVWVASGLVMWWRLPRLRAWGGVAVAGGVVSFLLLVWNL